MDIEWVGRSALVSRSVLGMARSTTVALALVGVATIASCSYACRRPVGADRRRPKPESERQRRYLPVLSTAQSIATSAAAAAAAAGPRAAVRRPAAAAARPVARRASTAPGGFLDLSSRGAGVSATHSKPKVSAEQIKALQPPELRRAARKQQGKPKQRTQGRAAKYRAEMAKQRAKVVAAVAMAEAKLQQPLLVPLDTTTQRAQRKKERLEKKFARADKKLAKDVVDRAFAAVLASMHENNCDGMIKAGTLVAEVTTEPMLTPEQLPQTRAIDTQLLTPRKQLKPTRRPAASPHRLHQTPDPKLAPGPAETEEHEVVAVLGDLARNSPVFSEKTSPCTGDEEQENEATALLKPFGVRLDQELVVPSSYGLIRIGAQAACHRSERLLLRAGRAMGIGPSKVLTVWYDSSATARYSARGGQEGSECYDALCEPILPSDQAGQLYMLGECALCGVCSDFSLPGLWG